MGHPDADAKLIGRNIHVMLTPLPVNKRKRKFKSTGEAPVDDGPDLEADDENAEDAAPPSQPAAS